MSQRCATPKCERTSRAICDCCSQNLCLQHLSEHNTLLVSQLNPLTDEINKLGDRLNRLNFNEVTHDCRKKLEEWHQDCHQKIDHFFEQKCQELDRRLSTKIDEQRQKTFHIQTKLAKLIREQEATRQDIDTLSSSIRELEKEINYVEQVHVEVNTRPLLIDDNMIHLKEINTQEFNLAVFSSVYDKIACPKGSWRALASNGRVLLLHQTPNLCFLDANLIVINKVLWEYNRVCDICWSTTLNQFIMVGKDGIFLVNEKAICVDIVSTIEKQNWFSCTCFDTELFLSTNRWGTSIFEIRLVPSIAVIKEWKSPKTCSIDEFIDDIVYDKEKLAIVIENNVKKSVHLELRSSGTLDRLWSCPLDIMYQQDLPYRFSSLGFNEWLIIDNGGRRFLHITIDEQLKDAITYKDMPYRICFFTSDIVAISTLNGVNFHKTTA